ncbi:MAG: hypothetical protein A2494_00860 [Candidatus Lloydbacteria bacterium RIFOXYC12_FULL_46_25]|uniref:DNA-directed DNA polymerase n=1 Tax=Candidatus Lloydbacteria bacterium RIFOXYC12_FULL_46_25 TaxID=1798670 RepID=A0A1G2DVB9_9BACT|nr:MAG: hypothetical protein A2494_00860 [Candidatus Lloydbacteria bacterium RIFOXYC12_FULL_46_25]
MKKRYGDNAHLLFTDTDSLMYEVETEDLYKDITGAADNIFDFSNYDKSHPCYKPEFLKNKAQVGLMKDETAGLIINEFVGLRPKMYSYTTVKVKEDGQIEYGEKHRAKGIQKVRAADFRHKDYLNQLLNPEENYVLNRRLGSKLHKIYGIEVSAFPLLPV